MHIEHFMMQSSPTHIPKTSSPGSSCDIPPMQHLGRLEFWTAAACREVPDNFMPIYKVKLSSWFWFLELEIYRKGWILTLSNGSGGDLWAFICWNTLLQMSILDWETTLESFFWIFVLFIYLFLFYFIFYFSFNQKYVGQEFPKTL